MKIVMTKIENYVNVEIKVTTILATAIVIAFAFIISLGVAVTIVSNAIAMKELSSDLKDNWIC